MKAFFLLFCFPLFSINYSYTETNPSSYFDYYFGYSSIHILEIDPASYEIKPIKAIDNGIGRESVFSITKRYQALAGINGGFFTIGSLLDGKACGALKIHDWYALPTKPRGCIGWSSQNGSILFDRILVLIEGTYQSESFAVDGLNRSRNTDEMILFTPVFHRTTLTYPDGEEIIVKDGVIQEIRKGQGSSLIPNNGYVLSIHEDHPLFGHFEVGSSLAFSFQIQTDLTQATEWDQCDYIVGGTPLLIANEAPIYDFSSERTIPSFLTKRHARTAIGILPDGRWIFVVVDQTKLFDGMTMDELRDLMSSLNCVYALNLDGGGSSTMVYKGKIKNSPRGDKDEKHKGARRVSDAIIITPKTPS